MGVFNIVSSRNGASLFALWAPGNARGKWNVRIGPGEYKSGSVDEIALKRVCMISL